MGAEKRLQQGKEKVSACHHVWEAMPYKGIKRDNRAFWFPQYLANFFFWDSPQEGKELHVLSPSQQLGYGIKLRAVAHVLMYFMDIC